MEMQDAACPSVRSVISCSDPLMALTCTDILLIVDDDWQASSACRLAPAVICSAYACSSRAASPISVNLVLQTKLGDILINSRRGVQW